MSNHLAPYINLLSCFVTGNISGTDLESQYFSLYKNETTLFPDEEFLILDKLFGDIDAFVAEPNLRDEECLDEEELQEHCLIALEKLRPIQTPLGAYNAKRFTAPWRKERC